MDSSIRPSRSSLKSSNHSSSNTVSTSKSRSRSRSRSTARRGRRLSTAVIFILPEELSSSPERRIAISKPSDKELFRLPSPFFPPSISLAKGIPSTYPTPDLPSEYPPLPQSSVPTKPDAKDYGTPDEWVLRDESLVRLTGRWPFNCEPPLPSLWDAGFLTPQALFYVRNHGVVPQVSQSDADAWSIEISGMVDNPITLTLSDLLDPHQFSPITLPVTLVCAGNRRKEQNVVRQSLGFSWGASGLSTALFTGVYLADVLEKVCPRNEGLIGVEGFKRAEHVIFEGAEDLPEGKYGTSQRLRWARMREKGMMLCWAMNGEALEPDHGYPLRLIVPGQIGGRSVKWLKKIIVSDKESQHHLHFWDNKVLPTTLLPEVARAEREWWYDPRYIINDLNTNSAIAKPAHDEAVTFSVSAATSQTYSLAGYAYAGGGRRITRVEITLDAGVTWELASISYPEDRYRTKAFKGDVWGTLDITDRDENFCWAFWEAKVAVSRLSDSGSVAVRAMDESLHLQGKSMYWNPTGMMNNWWFRVAIHKEVVDDVIKLRFEHPTMPGTQSGGWMARLKELGQDILDPLFTLDTNEEEDEKKIIEIPLVKKKVEIVMTKEGVDRKITMEEVQARSTEAEPWFVVDGQVYDGTGFLKKHPGGAESITIVAGQDASEDFNAIHSPAAKANLAEYHIGTLVISTILPPTATNLPIALVKPDLQFLHKTKWKSAQLESIELVNHDSRIYRFSLDHLDQPLGLPTGQHVYARLRRKGDARGGLVEGDLVQRAYTPVSSHSAKGHLDLLVKVYHRTASFPNGGKMSLGFEELQVGDKVEFKGPLGSFEWLGKGLAKWRGVERRAKNIGMICGGSGITPIIQVLRGIIHDVNDNETKLWLINSNRTEADILMRKELEELEACVGSARFQQHFCLSDAPEDWAHSRGRINLEMMRKHLPPVGEDSLILVCGPGPMIDGVVKPSLVEMGWDIESTLVEF